LRILLVIVGVAVLAAIAGMALLVPTEMSINKFAIGLGIALVLVGLLAGSDRFSVTSDGDTGTCSSYFSGPKRDIGDALAEQKRQLDELGTGRRYHGSTFADQCDSKRDQRGLFTWLLVGGGVVLVTGGALVRPAKREGAQPK
jgi:hypothetical protein